jgi:hypothetical protein
MASAANGIGSHIKSNYIKLQPISTAFFMLPSFLHSQNAILIGLRHFCFPSFSFAAFTVCIP